MLVECELSKIIINEAQEHQIITLRELIEPHREFPIVIGFFEAAAIDRKINEQHIPRPMTHDLLTSVIKNMGGQLERIIVNDLRETTFYAQLEIHRGEETIVVDSRPSDALALSVRAGSRVFVAEKVLQQVALGGEP
jgi:hypothetical protein